MKMLIRGADILTCAAPGECFRNGYMVVENGKITYVGTDARQADGTFDRVIEAHNQILMPGLVNTHTHVAMTGMRGYADDYVLQTWLNDYIFPVEDRMNAECVAISAQLGMAEMIATGTTSFSDMYSFCNGIAQAAADCGLKANISRGIVCPDDAPFRDSDRWKEAVELYDRWNGYDDGRILIDFSVHAEYTTNTSCRETVAAYAADKQAHVHFHLSETKQEQDACLVRHGVTPAQLFYREGLLNERALAAHCVWLTEEDMALFAQTGASVAHCPVSNLKLASGIAPLTAMDQAGINLSLGTDGVASNNNHDLFEEIKLASILQKGVTCNPEVFPAGKTLAMATVQGALAQGRRNCGVLRAGMDADFILLDTKQPSLQPYHAPDSACAYSAHGADVCMTVVRGRVLYENGEFLTLDREKIRADFERLVRPVMFP